MSEINGSVTSEMVRRVVGPVVPLGETTADAIRLENIKKLSAVLLDLLLDVVDVSRHAESKEASVAAIGKYATDTIGIVNENTGAWDDNERLRGENDHLRKRVAALCDEAAKEADARPEAMRKWDEEHVKEAPDD